MIQTMFLREYVMNDCMTKQIEQIRKENIAQKKIQSERKASINKIFVKNKKALVVLRREGLEVSEIARIINQCEKTDVTEHEIKEFYNQKENKFYFNVIFGFVFLFTFLNLIVLYHLNKIAYLISAQFIHYQ